MLEEIKTDLSNSMNKVLETLKHNLSKVRTGRASVNALDGIVVDYYGAPTPINQVGQISTPEARLLQIQPYDRNTIAAIEKAILASNIGLTPRNDGNIIRITFPSLTEDRRKQQVKNLKKIAEDSRVAVRNNRRDKNDIVKEIEKKKEISEDDARRYHNEIQAITDNHIKKIDEIVATKEKEIMSI